MARPEDFAALGAACRRHDVLLVCDEVATGFGRTGTLFASERAGVRPDLLCLGKGLTGGYLPMSATVASGRVFDAFLGDDPGPRTFLHGHSYGGNALAAAVALRHLAAGAGARRAGQRGRPVGPAVLRCSTPRLGASPAVREVRVRGLLAGVELAPPGPDARWGRRVCAAAVRRGVLLRPLGDVVVVVPPLTITAAEVDRIVDVLAAAVDEVAAA